MGLGTEPRRAVRRLPAHLMCIFGSAALLTGCLDVPEKKTRDVHGLVVVLDASVATDRRCDELGARLETITADRAVRRLVLAVMQTGDAASGYEPVTLIPWREFAPTRGLYEGGGKAAAARAAWIDEEVARCAANLKPVKASAIVNAAQRAVLSLRAKCAEIESGGGRCLPSLAVHSDLRENAGRYTTDALVELSRATLQDGRRSTSRELRLPRVDTGGIRVRVCGVADTEHTSGRAFVQPSVLVEVWTRILGVNPDVIDPICARGGTR